MIQIFKPSDIPQKLLVDGVNANNKNCLTFDKNKRLYNSKGKKPKITMEFDDNIYGCRKTVKEVLLTTQNYKCCYCEREFLAANLHVEHYRPKTRVKQANGERVLYPGYYWLAYEWDNLFLACHECNSSNKGDLFPLEHPSRRVRSHHGALSREKPLLIKPSDDARLHIEFSLYGLPQPKTKLGAQTIEDLGLLRDSLIKARLKKLIEVLDIRATIEDTPPPKNQRAARKLAHEKRRLQQSKNHGAEFSAMVNDVLSKKFDTVEHLLNLEKIYNKM